VTTRERKKSAVPPFITSKLQQASRFPVKKTMMVAQQLYEGIELPGEGASASSPTCGPIRPGCPTRRSPRRGFIAARFGRDYVPEKPNVYRTKKDAQDAHEAIRPTSMQFHPDAVRAHLTADQYYLYRLIWNRFVASQMPPATFDETTVDVDAATSQRGTAGVSVPGEGLGAEVRRLDGRLQPGGGRCARRRAGPGCGDGRGRGWIERAAAGEGGDRLAMKALRPEQKFTQPPPRYSEATLVKALEENGIGRPSTYASIIGVIQAREYVYKIDGRFKPTMLGLMLVERLLSPAFDDILDVGYTRELEEELDKIEEGKEDYVSALASFYQKFEKDLKRAAREMINLKEGVPPDPPVDCDKCGKPMVIKAGKFGLFLACSGYPECENTRELETPDPGAEGDLDETCENCGRPMAVKRGRFGQFLACTGYPECRTTRKIIATKQGMTAAKPDQVLDEVVSEVRVEPRAQARPVRRVHRLQQLPGLQVREAEDHRRPCPKDGGDIVEKKSRRGKVFYGCANYPDCDFTLWNRPVLETCPDCGAPFLVEKVTKRHGRQLLCNNEACSYVRSEELAPA
jgi:DNA topoisomerase I